MDAWDTKEQHVEQSSEWEREDHNYNIVVVSNGYSGSYVYQLSSGSTGVIWIRLHTSSCRYGLSYVPALWPIPAMPTLTRG